jgi:hypothetical protein
VWEQDAGTTHQLQQIAKHWPPYSAVLAAGLGRARACGFGGAD